MLHLSIMIMDEASLSLKAGGDEEKYIDVSPSLEIRVLLFSFS